MEYTTVDRIFSKLDRELKRDNVSEIDVVEMIGEALEFIGVSLIYEPAVAFIQVIGHQCEMPKHLQTIIQIARNNAYSPVVASEVVTTASVISTGEPDVPVALDYNGTPINEYELAYYRPYFDLIGEYEVSSVTSSCGKQFTPVRLATSTFFNTLVCKETDFDGIYDNVRDEYGIIGGTHLRFSFEIGQIAVSYLKRKIDCESGYPLIPDHISFTTAITAYIKMKLAETDFYNHREGAGQILARAEDQWQWYCGQAKNIGIMPKTLDEWENLLRQRNYLVPRTDRYNNFFGNLAHTEKRSILNGR
jgi:hypothetical protein